jgi:RHS repeat-associated protein
MREEGTLYWLLGDHLGSTSITAGANGTLYSELRYTAYGEVRYSDDTTPTDKRFTGQRLDSYINMYWYNSRWYDHELSHFIQADTIIPGAGNALGWNRYAYTLYNPIRYTDPTGHYVDDGCATEGCSYSPTKRREDIFNEHNRLQTQAGLGIINDLEALARLTEYAALVTKNKASDFVQDLGATLTGHSEGNAARNELQIQLGRILGKRNIEYSTDASYHNNYLEIVRNKRELMQGGYSSVFQDPGEGGNQAHHFWFNVQVGFESGIAIGMTGNFLHETVLASGPAGKSYQDYALGTEGVILGKWLYTGTVTPNEVGNWIRDTLSPGSFTERLWMDPYAPYYQIR